MTKTEGDIGSRRVRSIAGGGVLVKGGAGAFLSLSAHQGRGLPAASHRAAALGPGDWVPESSPAVSSDSSSLFNCPRDKISPSFSRSPLREGRRINPGGDVQSIGGKAWTLF